MRESSKAGHFDNRHSRWVARLKVVLPLAALAILSTVFLIADRRGSTEMPITDAATLDRLLTEGRVARPTYAGVGDDGATLSFVAQEAMPAPDGSDATQAVDLTGTWQSRSGAEITLTGDRGRLSGGSGDMRIEGDVIVIDAQGYELHSDALQVDGTSKDIVSPGPVVGTGNGVRIDAGGMSIVQRDDRSLAIFTKGVRVIYDPNATE